MMKRIFFFILIVILTVSIGKNLLPFKNAMFDFHDSSQPARISEFVFNIKNHKIPPRMAPHFSNNLGFPVFNFYAPFSYWVSSFINIIGFDVADTIKVSFLLSLVCAFIFMFLYLREFFDYWPSLVGAALYVASPYFAVEIFIRGNLGEVWFLTLFPLSLFLFHKNVTTNSRLVYLLSALAISFTLTVHNIFSLVFLFLGGIYIFLLKNKLKNLLTLVLGIFLSSYFLIPAVFESPLTYASEIVKQTNFRDHFLCWHQLWSAPFWGYGGSIPGCIDGMSLMLGKFQVVLGLGGGIAYLSSLFIKRKHHQVKKILFILILTSVSIFLTTYSSTFIWDLLPQLSILQFPWRLLVFGIFGLAYFAAYLFNSLLNLHLGRWAKSILVVFIIFLLFNNSKFFQKYTVTKAKFNQEFLSDIYIRKRVVYKVSEYLPKTVNYQEWLNFEPKKERNEKVDSKLEDGIFIHPLDGKPIFIIKNETYDKIAKTESNNLLLNIHYFPFWKVYINNREYMPKRFDLLGRPIIKDYQEKKIIALKFEQTLIERLANWLTILSFVILLVLLVNRRLWQKLLSLAH